MSRQTQTLYMKAVCNASHSPDSSGAARLQFYIRPVDAGPAEASPAGPDGICRPDPHF